MPQSYPSESAALFSLIFFTMHFEKTIQHHNEQAYYKKGEEPKTTSFILETSLINILSDR